MIVDSTVNTQKRKFRSWLVKGIIGSIIAFGFMYYFKILIEDNLVAAGVIALIFGFVFVPLLFYLTIKSKRFMRWFIKGIIVSAIVGVIIYALGIFDFSETPKFLVVSLAGGFILATVLPILFRLIRRNKSSGSSGSVYGGGWTSSST